MRFAVRGWRLAVGACCLAGSVSALEKIALIDTFDYATIFDIEKKSGSDRMLAHVARTGAGVMAWRNQSGGMNRYRSAEEHYPLADVPFSKLRIPESRPGYGFLNLHRGETDLLEYQFRISAATGLVPAVHFTGEENHYFSFTFSTWVLEHPEYWCAMHDGTPWPGHGAFSHPEEIAHRVRLLDEVIDRGAKVVILGTERIGGYGPRFEYTVPSIAEWKREHGGAEPPNGPRADGYRDWVRHCGRYFERFIRAIAARCRERNVRVILMLREIGLEYDSLVDDNGVDWSKLAAEGAVDGVSLYTLYKKDAEKAGARIVDVVDRIFARVAARKGKCDLYLPVNEYAPGIDKMAEWAGITRVEMTKKLLDLAVKHGAKGVTLGVVDYRNYPDDVMQVIREY